jgi:hypothetical protein
LIEFLFILQIYSTRGGGFSQSQHFDSPPVSPVPRLPSSPRISSSNNQSPSENTPNITEEKKPRSSKKTSTIINGDKTPNIDQQPVSYTLETSIL